VHFGGSLWDEEGTFELEKKVKNTGKHTHTHLSSTFIINITTQDYMG